jgi:putative endonuclease
MPLAKLALNRERLLQFPNWFGRTLGRTIDQHWRGWRLARPYPLRKPNEPVGAYGERIAGIYLQRCGYIILERSYRVQSGEIDLIAVWDRRVVVFVEVKTWSSQQDNNGGPSDAVDEAKQEKISQLALKYMKRHRLLEGSGRTDVIQIVLGNDAGRPAIRHFENAFEAVGIFQMYS